MKLIGLAGMAGAGKDYTYERLRDFYWPQGTTVERIALADGVRLEIQETLGQYQPVLWKKPYPDAIRRLLQWWGTDFRRAQNPNHWVDKTRERIEVSNAGIVCVTDVRFSNEADMIRDLGGIVVEVRANSHLRAMRLGGALPPDHASEDMDFEVDTVIHNELEDEIYIPAKLGAFLGLDTVCRRCSYLEMHPWHDNGDRAHTHLEYKGPIHAETADRLEAEAAAERYVPDDLMFPDPLLNGAEDDR